MARTKFKWKFVFFSYFILVNVFTKSLPISKTLPSLTTSNTVFHHSDVPDIEIATSDYKVRVAMLAEHEKLVPTTDIPSVDNSTEVPDVNSTDVQSRNALIRRVRPGQQIHQYALELTANGNTFSGRAILTLDLDFDSREDPIVLHVEDLNIQTVLAGVLSAANAIPADFSVDDGLLEISPVRTGSSYIVIIEYTGSLTTAGQGFFKGAFNEVNYLAMNLHPTHARRVFPCMDEPTEASTISFTFNGLEFNHVMTNSIRDETAIPNQFRALQGPAHLWSMAAHNLNNINVPTSGVFLYIRPGVSNQESQASVALNFYYNNLVEWTNKPYFEIIVNQAEQLSILALPDVSRDWYGLSTVALWEPYILMENTCSTKQRYTALQKMAEAMAKQWFGHVIYPENWRYEWVVSGLASYAAFDVLRDFQNDVTGLDISLLDVNTLFVTEVIQESLYRDGYTSALTLELEEDIFNEDVIRDYIYGIHKVKAPALFRMLRLILGDETQDFIHLAGRSLIAGRALQTINTFNFVDAINSFWFDQGNGRIDDVGEFLEPWIGNNGCPLIHVGLRQGGVLVTQERIGYGSLPHVAYNLPITYTISTAPDYENIYPIEMMEGTMTFNMFLDDEEGDYVLFNIQGQGYYRVNYDNDLWERIIEALNDPDRRAEIHPLNRATLIDDALNLARGGRIDYEIALMVVLTMEHETEYAPWRAFVRNMNFLRKRLVAHVWDDDDLDPDIYLRMVRRTIGAFEQEIGFTPDPQITEPAMTSLTRGLVMDHACRAGYQPCIAAAVDWFFDPNSNEPVVNPNIPSDIRPAVYCTMVREGGDNVINALYARLNIEVSMWERVVILESLTCSSDGAFVRTLLEETIAVNSEYTTEERVKIFIAAAESSYENAWIALNFLSQRVIEIRNMYGGAERLEEIINALTENMGDGDISGDFVVWVFAQNNNLDDSQFPAERAAAMVTENRDWDTRHRDYVYEWIDENDAPTLVVSLLLISISCIIGFFNH